MMRDERGIVLVLTLMILALITAMVVEFAYGVYTTTSALTNWKELQRLSFVSKSGISLAVKTIREWQGKDELYMYLGQKIPFENMMEGFSGSLVISAEDENGKFNLNSINKVSTTGTRNAYNTFVRLLKKLNLDERIADRVAYWINKNSVPELKNSLDVTKDSYMDSVDELLLIRGVDAKTYEALLPYVTVYGYVSGGSTATDDSRINMNTASIPVIISLGISEKIAEAIVNNRKIQPFVQPGDLDKTGLDSSLRTSISDMLIVGSPVNFHITSVAEENKIKRVIDCVVSGAGTGLVRFWREQ